MFESVPLCVPFVPAKPLVSVCVDWPDQPAKDGKARATLEKKREREREGAQATRKQCLFSVSC